MESLCITDYDDFHEEITDEGLSYLSTAVNLQELEVGVQSLTTLEGLGNLQNLKKLTLNGYAGLSDLPSSAYEEVSKLTGHSAACQI